MHQARSSCYLILYAFLTAAMIAGGFTGCSGGGGGGGDPGTTVALAGSALTPGSTTNVPVYWLNRNITQLSRIDSTCDGYANSIVISGSDVYVAGTTYLCSSGSTTKVPVAALWKNGVRTDLPRPAGHANGASEAQQVVVADGSVYVAGYVTGDAGMAPVYWKNGTIVYLTDLPYGGTNARASNIEVAGGSVYVSGAEVFDASYPVYWKDGTATKLPVYGGYQGTSAPLPIKVDVTDVYVFAQIHHQTSPTNLDRTPRPVVWKNGQPIALSPVNSSVGAVYGGAVYQGTTYAAGDFFEGTLFTPSLWVGTTRQRLSMIDETLYGIARDVVVKGGSIYVTGFTFMADPVDSGHKIAVPCYWVNGVRVDIGRLGNASAYARAIFVP